MLQVVREGLERLDDEGDEDEDEDEDEHDFLLLNGPWECKQNIPLGVHVPFV